MNLALFCVAFGLAVAYMAWVSLKTPLIVTLPVVKAGKVSDFFKENIRVSGVPRVVYTNSGKINTCDYEVYYVHGNSMVNHGIKNGDRILVDKISEDKKHSIKNFPVLILTITDTQAGDAKFKLRKFISYVDYTDGYDWAELYERFANRITVSREQFINQCESKRGSELLKGKNDLILSETYNEKEKYNEYSLHPIDTIYGKVEYAFK